MAFVDNLAVPVFLVIILGPWIGVALSLTLTVSDVGRHRLARFSAVGLLLLTALLTGLLVRGDGWERISWDLPVFGSSSYSGFFDRVVWHIDLQSVGLLCAGAVTLLYGCWRWKESSLFHGAGQLALFGLFSLVVVADDLGSLMTGFTGMALLLSSWFGTAKSDPGRRAASVFAGVHITAAVVLFAGLAALVGIVAVVRVAPYGLPGEASSIISEIFAVLKQATKQHPEPKIVWGQQQVVPLLLITIGTAITAGWVPIHSWIFVMFDHLTKRQRLWTILWTKVSVLFLFRILVPVLSQDDVGIRGWIVWAMLLGSVVVAFRGLASSNNRHRLAAMVVWSSQLSGMVALSLSDKTALLIVTFTQFAGLVVLNAVVSQDNEETRPTSFHRKVVLLATMPLVLTPIVTGDVLSQLLNVSSTSLSILSISGSWWLILSLVCVGVTGWKMGDEEVVIGE